MQLLCWNNKILVIQESSVALVINVKRWMYKIEVYTKLMLMAVVSIELNATCKQVDLFIRRMFPPGEMGEWEKSVFEVVLQSVWINIFFRFASRYFWSFLFIRSFWYRIEMAWMLCARYIQTNNTANGFKRNVFAFNSRPLRLCAHATVPLLLIVLNHTHSLLNVSIACYLLICPNSDWRRNNWLRFVFTLILNGNCGKQIDCFQQ